MGRVTEAFLRAQVTRINEMCGTPMTSWSDGKANIGNFHLYFAYGGVSLHQMVTTGGGVNDVFRCGCMTKRELSDRMDAFISGLNRDGIGGHA